MGISSSSSWREFQTGGALCEKSLFSSSDVYAVLSSDCKANQHWKQGPDSSLIEQGGADNWAFSPFGPVNLCFLVGLHKILVAVSFWIRMFWWLKH